MSTRGVRHDLGVTAAWLSKQEHDAWVSLAATMEMLPALLDSQLRRDSGITHFEYLAMSMLAAAPKHTMRMTELASQTNATLPRLSHVARRLETSELVERFPCPEDRRATNVKLTAAGLRKVKQAAPRHVDLVRRFVIDALSAEQVTQLHAIGAAILEKLDPTGVMAATLRNRP